MFRVERIYRPASTLSTRVYLPRNRYAISMLAVHFHHCRMFAEYRRFRRAMICFIHFSHSKFITFRKTDSFIPRVLKLFSATVLDINDYGKIAIDSRKRISRVSARSRFSITLPAKRTKDKMLRLRRLRVKLYYCWKNARPGYLGVVNSKCIIQRGSTSVTHFGFTIPNERYAISRAIK